MTNANRKHVNNGAIERSTAGGAVRFRVELGLGIQSMEFNGVAAEAAGAVVAATVYPVGNRFDVLVTAGNQLTHEAAIVRDLNAYGFIDKDAAEAYAFQCCAAARTFWEDSVVED